MARMLTIEQFANESGIPAVTVRRHVLNGSLPATRQLIKGKKFKYLINEEELTHTQRGGDTKLAQLVREHEQRIRTLEELLRAHDTRARRDDPNMPSYIGTAHETYTPRVGTMTTRDDHAPEQVGGVTVYWYNGLVSKGSCVKIAIAHGATKNSAVQMPIADAQRIDIRTAFEYIKMYLTRPAAINRWQLCTVEGCICGRLDDEHAARNDAAHLP